LGAATGERRQRARVVRAGACGGVGREEEEARTGADRGGGQQRQARAAAARPPRSGRMRRR